MRGVKMQPPTGWYVCRDPVNLDYSIPQKSVMNLTPYVLLDKKIVCVASVTRCGKR